MINIMANLQLVRYGQYNDSNDTNSKKVKGRLYHMMLYHSIWSSTKGTTNTKTNNYREYIHTSISTYINLRELLILLLLLIIINKTNNNKD